MKKMLLVTVLLITAQMAQAGLSFLNGGSRKNELDLNLSELKIHSYKIGDESYTDINILGSYSYLLQSELQLLVEAGIGSSNYGTEKKTLLTLMGGATYNFDSRLDESFFVQGAIGLHPAFDKDDLKYDSQFSFFVGAGKRFSIWNNVTLKPLIRISKFGEMDAEFLIQPLNVSIIF